MKHYRCPNCDTTRSVIRKTKRGDSIRFFCKACLRYFSVSTVWTNRRAIMNDHLEGLSFRSLGRKYGISKSQAWDICHEELSKLPDNNQFTYRNCERFSKVFLFDGKYFNIASYPHDWVILLGIDYFRHDIPVFTIAPGETYQSWGRYFVLVRILNLHPKLLVCDDHAGLKLAARMCFPRARVQTCYNHFKEGIRRGVRIRSKEGEKYRDFVRRLESVLDSTKKRSDETFNRWMSCLWRDYREDPVCLAVMVNIERSRKELFGYRGIPQAPLTTNMIEGFNSQLERRLQSLRSFQSVAHARLWWNGFILKRRLTPFTDCEGKFRHLRGKTGVGQTKKQGVVIPSYF